MTIYSLYIFDRHCNCVYYHDWHRTARPKPPSDPNALIPGISRALQPQPPSTSANSNSNTHTNSITGASSVSAVTPFTSPRNTLTSTSGIVIATGTGSADDALPPWAQDHHHRAPNAAVVAAANASAGAGAGAQKDGGGGGSGAGSNGAALPFDEEAKLVYGLVLSLRTMVKRLAGRADEQFTSYRTSAYRLHLYETLTGYKLVMLTDPNLDALALRPALRAIHAGPFVEYVVRNPLVRMDDRARGVDNEYFRASVDRLVRGLSVFA